MPESQTDQLLSRGLRELFQRFEAELPARAGAVFIAYTRKDTAIDITGLVTNDAAGHYLRVLDAAKLFGSDAARTGPPRVYRAPDIHEASIDHDLQVSMLFAFDLADGKHELVRIWNRGNRCGELIVQRGDGEHIAASFGLVFDDRVFGEDAVDDVRVPVERSAEAAAEDVAASEAHEIGVRNLKPYRELAERLRRLANDARARFAAIGPEFAALLESTPLKPDVSANAITRLCDEIEQLRPLRGALGRMVQRNQALLAELEALKANRMVMSAAAEPAESPPPLRG
jgi:hypothetical protein